MYKKGLAEWYFDPDNHLITGPVFEWLWVLDYRTVSSHSNTTGLSFVWYSDPHFIQKLDKFVCFLNGPLCWTILKIEKYKKMYVQ
jgi:hypothetical protein